MKDRNWELIHNTGNCAWLELENGSFQAESNNAFQRKLPVDLYYSTNEFIVSPILNIQ